jgi:hypothetical protein
MKPLAELSADTIGLYRHQLRQLWLRERAGFASPQDVAKRKLLEFCLGIKAASIPAQGRPRVKA